MKLIIGLDSWVIQDGNYKDFKTGDIVSFALEFYSKSLQKSNNINTTIEHLKEDLYYVRAKVKYVKKNQVWVIEWYKDGCQYMAYQEGACEFEEGDIIEGTIHLGIDPFFYLESYRYKKDFPKMHYRWEIKKIELETTPWEEITPFYFKRDESKKSFASINKTDAHNDLDGDATYLLCCKRLDCE